MTVTRQLLIFYSIAFAYTWLVAAWMILAHVRIEFSILASCGPTIAAIIANRLSGKSYWAFRLNENWLRTLGATTLGVFLIVAAYVIFPATATVDPKKLNWSALASTSMYNYSTLLGGPLFEEPGWRGYALPRLESRFSPLLSSLIVGTLWAIWHLPFFLYPGWSSCPIWIYFLILTGLSVLMAFAANLARFGVIAPVAMHAIFNSTGGLLQGLFANAEPGSGGFLIRFFDSIPKPQSWSGHLNIRFELIIAVGGWITACLVVALTKGRLGYPPSKATQS